MKIIKVRMYNPDANKMHFDLEDDVIKCPKGVNDVIDFKYGAFWLKKRDVSLYHFKYVLKSPIEVIGNIHINPELA